MDRALAGLTRALRASREVRSSEGRSSKGKLKLSPARRRALQLHGSYLGYIRQLKPRQRAELKRFRARKGVRAAITRARKLAGR